MKIRAVWNGGKTFVADAEGMAPLSIEWGDERKNLSPMELLLVALAGCTGVDVVDILTKMRERITRVEVSVEGQRREEYPRIWNRIEVRYDIFGANVPAEKAQKAVALSVEKYCSVSAMFRPEIELRHSFVIHDT